MANLLLLPTLVFVCLISANEAISFNNAYIQNAKSGRCVTIDKDALLNPLSASKCNCGPYQFWKMEDGEHVTNELAFHRYMDELFGKPGNGETVGIYDLTGLNWQKWRVNEGNDDGIYTFVNRHTSKCLRQGAGGKIDQWDCDDDDQSQQWKIVQDPCGKLARLPTGRFQLQNPETGKCAVIQDNSDAWWAKVVIHKCSCGNDYHYWKLNKETLISEGKSKQCLANWEALGHPGVTQCICANDAIHRWRFSPNEDGTFNLVTSVDGKCVHADSDSGNSQLGFEECERGDVEQKWRFYDACHPEPPPTPKPPPPPVTPALPIPPPQPTNVIPTYLVYFFDNGNMNWLTPTRYTLLVGGHLDPVTLIWYTVDGREVKPNTEMWTIYFGDTNPSFLGVLFPDGKAWNDVFGWMTIEFFQTWTDWRAAPLPPPQPKDVIPDSLAKYFTNGQMNWLNPERYNLLIGGRWDPVTFVWFTVDGRQIRPSSLDWTTYFGDLQPSQMNIFFPNGGSWNDLFGWITPAFFQRWTGWQQTSNIPIVISGYIPTATSQLFVSGDVNWLTPDRIKMLEGGQWTGSEYVTRTQVHVTPGTPSWMDYFGATDAASVNTLFSGPGSWDMTFGWLTDAVKNVPSGMFRGGSFPWDNFFRQMIK